MQKHGGNWRRELENDLKKETTNQTKRNNPKKYPGGYVPGHSLHLAPLRGSPCVKVTEERNNMAGIPAGHLIGGEMEGDIGQTVLYPTPSLTLSLSMSVCVCPSSALECEEGGGGQGLLAHWDTL